MLTKIAENIYKKEIPLPENPLRYINVYIITGEKTLVVDTGFNRPECEAALMEALEELGVKEADLFITHLHSDHCGLISKYGDMGWKIYAGETDGELMNFEAGNLYWRMLDDLFIKFGFPKADFGRNTDIHPGRTWCHPHPVKFTYVKDGDVLEYGGYQFRVIETPGHTPGHMCLYDEANRRLICGDHILGLITPNITIELSLENPLQAYLESLAKVDALEVNELLTTHGIPVDDMHQRISELYHHHEVRLAEVVKILGDEWKNAYETARDMTWEIDCRNWDEFPAPQKWFATGEAISHLQYLYFTGKVAREEQNGVYHYRNLKAD